MSHDHIGVPRFIENGFSINKKVYCYNLKINKCFKTSTDRLGTKKDYFSKEVETDLLANGIESDFTDFYKLFCETTDDDEKVNILNSNKELVTQFISFMFFRSINSLNLANENCLSSKIIGEMDHSEFLKISSIIKLNPLKMIGDNYKFYPIINLSEIHFINNSIGLGIQQQLDKCFSFYIPLNIKVGILVSNSKIFENIDRIYIKSNDFADKLNKSICFTEKEIGNGFIFGENEVTLLPYIDIIKKLTECQTNNI